MPVLSRPAATSHAVSMQAVTMPVERRVRWAARHGVARTVLRRAARKGHLDARLMTDLQLQDDPFPSYELMRAKGLLYRGPISQATGNHALCTEVLRSDAFGVGVERDRLPRVARGVMRVATHSKTMSPIDPPSLLAIDPPDHTRLRRLVTRVFTARAIEGLRGRTEQIADALLDELATRDPALPVDLVEHYSSLLPVTVIAEILGVPQDMHAQFLRWGGGASVTLDLGISYRAFANAERDVIALDTWMRQHFTRLRQEPGDNLLSQLVRASDEDELLDEDELSATAMLLLGAGFETTVNLLGNGVDQLLRHPAELALLRDDPSLWPNAVEEVLRYDSPVQRTARFARKDTEVGGVRIPAGSVVVTLLGSANRDPEVFTDPQRFDVRRANARDHLSFSSGVHYCLGAALARMEGEVGMRRLFERFPDLALAGPPHRRQTRVLRGYDSMPVVLGAHVDPAHVGGRSSSAV